MPGEHGRWLPDMGCLAPAVPPLRQPGPQQTINRGETKSRTAGTIDHGELVSECDDLQVQRCAGANEKAERMELRDDDRRHESRLSKNVHEPIDAKRTVFSTGTAVKGRMMALADHTDHWPMDTRREC